MSVRDITSRLPNRQDQAAVRPQRAQATGNPVLHRAERLVEGSGDFAVGQTTDEGKRQRVGLWRRESLESDSEALLERSRQRDLLWPWCSVGDHADHCGSRLVRDDVGALAAAATVLVEGEIARNANEPGTNRSSLLAVGQAMHPEAQEGLLADILGRRLVSHNLLGNPPYLAHMPGMKHRECGPFTAPDPSEQDSVG